MKPKFTQGEWMIVNHDHEPVTTKDVDKFGLHARSVIRKNPTEDGHGNDYREMLISADDYCLEVYNPHDARLIELAPLLAQNTMKNYYKTIGEWWSLDGDSVDDKETIYLLDELSKLYEENGEKCDNCNGGGYVQVAVDGVDCCCKCEGIGFLYEEGES